MVWAPVTTAPVPLSHHHHLPACLLSGPWQGPCGILFPQQLPAPCLAEQLTFIVEKPKTDSPSFGNLWPQCHYCHLCLHVNVHAVPGSHVTAPHRPSWSPVIRAHSSLVPGSLGRALTASSSSALDCRSLYKLYNLCAHLCVPHMALACGGCLGDVS